VAQLKTEERRKKALANELAGVADFVARRLARR
jgi:hypothetical protein